MTNKQALQAVVNTSVEDNLLIKALLDQEITDSDSYTKDNAEGIDKAAIDVLTGLLSAANVSEGGYSISWDRAAIERSLKLLCAKHGLDDPTIPKVNGTARW